MSFVNIPRNEIEQPLIDPGTYSARIDKVKIGKSAAQNDKMSIIWAIMGTEAPGGAKVPDNVTLIPEAYWKLNQLFQACNFTPGDTGFNAEELIGKECRISVQHKEVEGTKRYDVTSYMPLM